MTCARCGREIKLGEAYGRMRSYTLHEGPTCPKVEPDDKGKDDRD